VGRSRPLTFDERNMKHCLTIVSAIVLTATCLSAHAQQSGTPLTATSDTERASSDVIADFECSVPTLHESDWKATSLSTSVWHWIHRRAVSVMPPKTSIWFILNIPGPGDVESDGRDWNVNVYYTPQEVSGRICKGKFISLLSFMDNPERGEKRQPELKDYWHVVSEGTAFTNSPPPSSALPFQIYGTLPERAVVELVDLVRPKGGGPISSIEIQDDGRIFVTTATSRAGLAGRGKIYVFEKKNDSWVLVDELDWIS